MKHLGLKREGTEVACEGLSTREEMHNSIQLDPNVEKKTYTKDFYYLMDHRTCFRLKCLKCDAFSRESSS